MNKLIGRFVVFLVERLMLLELMEWYRMQLSRTAFQDAAHFLWPEKVPPRRFRDDLLVWVLFLFLFPALIVSKPTPKTSPKLIAPEAPENECHKRGDY